MYVYICYPIIKLSLMILNFLNFLGLLGRWEWFWGFKQSEFWFKWKSRTRFGAEIISLISIIYINIYLDICISEFRTATRDCSNSLTWLYCFITGLQEHKIKVKFYFDKTKFNDYIFSWDKLINAPFLSSFALIKFSN